MSNLLNKTLKIVIDPGHGGDDKYNRGKNGYIEAMGVLAISLYMKFSFLEYANVEVIMTRDRDETVSLNERAKMGTKETWLFLSEHTDASSNPSVRGTSVFYSVDIPSDKVLAEKLSAAISGLFGVPDRGAKVRYSEVHRNEDYYRVVDGPQDNGTEHVLLVESLFHSNVEDEKILKNERNLKKIAQVQVETIAEHFGLVKKIDLPSGWASESWEWAKALGLNDGHGPRNSCTEEQVMTFLYRFAKKLAANQIVEETKQYMLSNEVVK